MISRGSDTDLTFFFQVKVKKDVLNGLDDGGLVVTTSSGCSLVLVMPHRQWWVFSDSYLFARQDIIFIATKESIMFIQRIHGR